MPLGEQFPIVRDGSSANLADFSRGTEEVREREGSFEAYFALFKAYFTLVMGYFAFNKAHLALNKAYLVLN